MKKRSRFLDHFSEQKLDCLTSREFIDSEMKKENEVGRLVGILSSDTRGME